MGEVRRNSRIPDSEWAAYPSLFLTTARLHSGTLLGEDDGNQSWKLCPCQIRGAITIIQLMNEPLCQLWVYYNQNWEWGMGCWGINELLRDCFGRAPNFMFVHWELALSMDYSIILSQGWYRPWRSPSPANISCLNVFYHTSPKIMSG